MTAFRVMVDGAEVFWMEQTAMADALRGAEYLYPGHVLDVREATDEERAALAVPHPPKEPTDRVVRMVENDNQ